MKKIGIWVEHSFQLYSAKPVFKKYINKGDNVYLITSINDINLCTSYLNISNERIINLNHLKKNWHSLFTLLFEIVFVPENFSMVYKARNLRNESNKIQLLRKIFFIKLKKHQVNKYYIKYKNFINYLGFRSTLPIKLDLIISFTKVNYTFLLPTETPHISIMESWDHPMKLPYFISPNYSLTWNKDLKNDTIYFQDIKRISKIKPLKFRYIYDRLSLKINDIKKSINNTDYLDELKLLDGKKIILYPTTTSSIGIGHEGEIKLISELCKAIKGTNYLLYIKPKPNGPEKDYDTFKKYENVIVGMYSSNPDSRDMLDENYQAFRYLLLKRCEVVINAGTTFVLEAALMDKKILQLKLKGGYFGKFTEYSNNYHLTKYILDNPFVFDYKGGNEQILSEAIENSNTKFKDYIKPWITSW